MTSKPSNSNQGVELDPEKEYRALVRSIRWTKGFGLLFVQCSPAEGNRLIERVREDVPEKRIEVLSLKESINNLYNVVDTLPNKNQIDTLFIQGIEYSLYEYEKTQLWDEPEERYNYSEKGLPRLLGHLNLARERFRDDFKIFFIFLVPKFALKYLIRRAPDFFDWRSGVLEFVMDAKRLQQESEQICCARGKWEDYTTLTPEKRREEILRIQALVDEPEQFSEQKVSLWLEQARLYDAAEEYAEAISSYDHALVLKPNHDKVWHHRGMSLHDLERYEEAIASYNRALELEPDEANIWVNRGRSLHSLERYEEAIASYNRALELEPDNAYAWFNRGLSLAVLGRYEEASASNSRAFEFKPDLHFTWVRKGEQLQTFSMYQEAITSYKKVLELNPSETVCKRLLKPLCLLSGKNSRTLVYPH